MKSGKLVVVEQRHLNFTALTPRLFYRISSPSRFEIDSLEVKY